MKHALLFPLIRAMQRKEKGFFYLDTHAGRGRYDLAAAARGDSLVRQPEWPAGVGRLWTATDLPPVLAEYVARVRSFDGHWRASAIPTGRGPDAPPIPAPSEAPRYYPGSPWIAHGLLRSQDRMALCEKHPDECETLRTEFGREKRVTVQCLDGYTGVRAMLPAQEKRAFVLIDPPFEEQDEFARVIEAITAALVRMPAAMIVVWYPLTERARADAFIDELAQIRTAPSLTAELMIVPTTSSVKMQGCGLAVVNPPWQIEDELLPVLRYLKTALAQESGGTASVGWIVPEKP